jgi:hypothetical protein
VTISVTIKLYAGLDIDAGVAGYDPATGVSLQIPNGARLKHAVNHLGLPDRRRLTYFIDGTRVGLWRKLKDGDEISCLRPLAGG